MAGTILITGPTGNIGAHLVKQLAAQGEKVRAAVHSMKNVDAIKGTGADFVEVDLTRRETIETALKGVEKLFLLTPLVPNMAEIGTEIVDAAKKAGVKYIVRSSGLGADAEPGITLGKWHRQVEKAVEASGIPYTILRPNSFMQNYINFFAYTIKTQNAFYFPLGDGRVSLVDAPDIASVAAVALTESGHEGKTYNITGPDAISNVEIAEIFSNKLGRKITYIDVSDNDARLGMKNANMQGWLIDLLMELYGIQKTGYAAAVSPAVKEITGKEPISFEQFVQGESFA